ncbi:MAG TPA: helix-turn-helix transcriptional regulator [Solirubrobacteraceae bacterium]|jgi:transcriptional regulator with XRE-family HTH domain
MRIEASLTDDAVLAELGRRLSRWRLERNLSQAQFSEQAGVARRTLQRLEAGEPVQLSSFIRVLRALDLSESIDRLVPEPTPSPLERLKLARHERRRARPRKTDGAGEQVAPWAWGDELGGEADA